MKATFVELQNGRIKRANNRFDGERYHRAPVMKPFYQRQSRRQIQRDGLTTISDCTGEDTSTICLLELGQTDDGSEDSFNCAQITTKIGADGKLAYACCAP